ncbi:MAG: EAL domain-containing protein [Butyrivibrio sp.]|nr:EAL domain-containing protein [Butyrivibrio sp.]
MNQIELERYVIENIDKACEKGWIKVYYQPIIRAITGKLAGVEALARWDDPEVGFLMPDKFITILEDNNLIIKLDCFILNKVCEDINDRISNGLQPVQASINFSKLDFFAGNMLSVIEETVKRNNISRDLIHIEITETTIASDEEFMKKTIDEFRDRGYAIWLDDFGSGYSSLNVLKDYSIDVLKLDMRFLSSDTKKSRTVLQSIVNMAKDIDISVVIEGVETDEQIRFLKSIGADFLQGYFYSKPREKSTMDQFLMEKNISIERRKWHKFYDLASHYARESPVPINIIEANSDGFKSLYVNSEYRRQAFVGDASLESLNMQWFSDANPIYDKLKFFAETVSNSTKQVETFYYSNRGFYFGLQVQELINEFGSILYKAALINFSLDKATNEKERLDGRIRELHNLFESILIIDLKKDKITPLIGGYSYLKYSDILATPVNIILKRFAENKINPSERQSYLDFINLPKTSKWMIENNKSSEERLFRVKQDDGSYKWCSIILIPVPDTNSQEFIYTIRKIPYWVAESIEEKEKLAANHIDEKTGNSELKKTLWDNIVSRCDLKFFWKDKERRFLGASQAFLDFYGFKSVDEIIGKTDEDMHWHVDNNPYMDDEIDVINHGKYVCNAPGQCIVKGVVHNIVCYKMPIYSDNQIIGLIGYFEDSDEEINKIKNIKMPSQIDELTGVMNAKFFVLTHLDYEEEYVNKNRNYGMILIENLNHNRLINTFHEEFADNVLKEIADKIVDVVGQKAAAAHTKGPLFVVMTYTDTLEELIKMEQELIKSVESINEVDGQTITIRIKTVHKLRNEEGINSENMYSKLLEELMI